MASPLDPIDEIRLGSSTQHGPDRVYVPTDTSGTLEGCRIAASWLERRALGWEGEPLVVVPTNAYSNDNDYLIGMTLKHRWETSLAYQGARAHGWLGGPVVLIYPNIRVLDWFDREPSVPVLCAVQGSVYDTTAWAKAHRPEDLTTGQPFSLEIEIDAVVAVALDAVQRSGSWHSLSSADDVSLLVRTLRLLQAHGHAFEPRELEAWAFSQDWKGPAVERLRAYADKVSEKRQIPLRSTAAPPHGALSRWHRLASEKDMTPGPDAAYPPGSAFLS